MPTPVSALLTTGARTPPAQIMKVSGAALAVLLCAAALCGQVSSVPRESRVVSVGGLTLRPQSDHSRFSCGLESPRGKTENFLKGYKASLLLFCKTSVFILQKGVRLAWSTV